MWNSLCPVSYSSLKRPYWARPLPKFVKQVLDQPQNFVDIVLIPLQIKGFITFPPPLPFLLAPYVSLPL